MNDKEIQLNNGANLAPKTPKVYQKWNRTTFKKSKKRVLQKRCKADAARATLFDLKCNSLDFENVYVSMFFNTNTDTNTDTGTDINIKTNTSTNINTNTDININEFKYYFFSEKSTDFSRLPSISKLLLSQFVLNNQLSEAGLISIPFVYRYNLEQQTQTQQQINKKICRVLTDILQRNPLFWLYPEYDDKKTQILTHTNGEIVIYPHEFRKLIKAFLKIHGKNNTDGTKNKNLQGNKIIKTLTPSRNKWAVKVSNFYSIYNWVAYSTKQQKEKRIIHQLNAPKKIYTDKDKLYYISADLKKSATNLYKEIGGESGLKYLSDDRTCHHT